MNRRILLGITFTLALAVLQASAFAQAAAESVLLGAGSSAATVKAGSTLGSALNQGSKQLAGRVQRQMVQPAPGKMPPAGAQPVSTSPVQGTAVGAGATPVQGAVITSIQGAATSRAPTSQKAATPGSQAAAASKPAPQKYKSAITLPLPK